MARRNSRKEKEREKTTTGSEKEKCSCKRTEEIIQGARRWLFSQRSSKVVTRQMTSNQKQTCNLENFKERKLLDMLQMLNKISMHPYN